MLSVISVLVEFRVIVSTSTRSADRNAPSGTQRGWRSSNSSHQLRSGAAHVAVPVDVSHGASLFGWHIHPQNLSVICNLISAKRCGKSKAKKKVLELWHASDLPNRFWHRILYPLHVNFTSIL